MKNIKKSNEEILAKAHSEAFDMLQRAHNAMVELAAMRLENKLSNTRIGGVARELGELIKVVYVSCCRSSTNN